MISEEISARISSYELIHKLMELNAIKCNKLQKLNIRDAGVMSHNQIYLRWEPNYRGNMSDSAILRTFAVQCD